MVFVCNWYEALRILKPSEQPISEIYPEKNSSHIHFPNFGNLLVAVVSISIVWSLKNEINNHDIVCVGCSKDIRKRITDWS